ncbi:MAG: HAD family hydrolase [Firmicutes bacterium]|nr:HAD family hydrolase [Bacillota bacterium]
MRAVFFDWDDTLCDFFHAYRVAVAHLHERVRPLGYGGTADELSDLLATVWAGQWPRFLAGSVSEAQLREGWMKAALLQAIGAAAESEHKTLTAAYEKDVLDNLRLYPDVVDSLARLRTRCALGIITNGPHRQQLERIRALGVHELVDAVVISGEHMIFKPDPRIFELARAALPTAVEACTMVGDSFAADIRGAVAAGWQPVWVNRGGHPLPFGADPEEASDVLVVDSIRTVADLYAT